MRRTAYQPPAASASGSIVSDSKREAGEQARHLTVDIHDSDVATITFAPAPPSGGLVYLGYQPRDYFEDPDASGDVDLDEQAAGLAAWAHQVTGVHSDVASIRSLLADDQIVEPVDTFVEDTVARLLALLGSRSFRSTRPDATAVVRRIFAKP